LVLCSLQLIRIILLYMSISKAFSLLLLAARIVQDLLYESVCTGNLWWRQKLRRRGAASDAAWDETLTTATNTSVVSCKRAYFWCSGTTLWTSSCCSRFVKMLSQLHSTLPPVHTADATKLSAVWTQFATSSRQLPTDLFVNLEIDQTDSIEFDYTKFDRYICSFFNNDVIMSSLLKSYQYPSKFT